MPTPTSRLGLSRPVLTPTPDPVTALRTSITDNANKLDTAGLFLHGNEADRPAAGIVDRYWTSDDTGSRYRDNGTSWEPLPGADDALVMALALGD
jgi:hypothetical protein